MTKLMFVLDTNVFIHAKNFTQIPWGEILDGDFDDISILIPHMVLMELDKKKYHEKAARKAIDKIRDIETNELQIDRFELISSSLPPNWNELSEPYKQILVKEESDHQIFAEILIYGQKHPDTKMIFVTGDYIPSKLANELEIECIYWLDKEFKGYFEKEKPVNSRYEPLEIYFAEKEGFLKEITVNKVITSQDPLTMKDFEEEFSTPTGHILIQRKSEDRFQQELEEYNSKMEEICRYVEISLLVRNYSNIPYTDVDVSCQMKLEKGFKIKYTKDVEVPKKPKTTVDIGPLIPNVIPHVRREPNVKDYEIVQEEKERNNLWTIQNCIKKIKHNENEYLYPFVLWIPEDCSTEKINIHVEFTQDQEGKVKEQKLTINLVQFN